MAGRAHPTELPHFRLHIRERAARLMRRCVDMYQHRHDSASDELSPTLRISRDWNLVGSVDNAALAETASAAAETPRDPEHSFEDAHDEDLRGSLETLVLQALRAGFQSVDPELLQRVTGAPRHSKPRAVTQTGTPHRQHMSAPPAIRTPRPPTVARPPPDPRVESDSYGEAQRAVELAILDTLRTAAPQLVQELVGPPHRDQTHWRSQSAPAVTSQALEGSPACFESSGNGQGATRADVGTKFGPNASYSGPS
ncbi:hypothetical protein EXIGLDRAFT_775895 [Exidia glandulosa HHB12029]|uniref:Uncharacterized protein n=1 Tax=Exidia glandulosa HHB12029 TaxID=1314781 RepID=A0A165DPR5_EXIGL|nr:hypothetical protein EXIGLDRAFT_775895 [Exidia glandulosa HHB12029]